MEIQKNSGLILKIFNGPIRLFQSRPKTALSILSFISLTIIIYPLYRMIPKVTETNLLEDAALYSNALRAFRTLYTSEVVARVEKHKDFRITHNYQDFENAIPLPVTLSLLLGDYIGLEGKGGKTKLYSPYPFPWRKEQSGLRDDFAKDAWIFLNQNSKKAFYRIETINDQKMLRYATADRMRSSCIRCHNTHPQSPKTDWKIGDVRGVLEVDRPIATVLAQTRPYLNRVVLIVTLVVMGILGILAIFMYRLQETGTELQTANNNLKEKTKSLENEKATVEKSNYEIQKMTQEIKEKAHEAQVATRHKSEFVTHMSHELRSPLNNMLVLAELLSENPTGNLTKEQVRFVQIILKSGNELLKLINESLDLAKVESGRLNIKQEEILIQTLTENLQSQFSEITKRKNLQLIISIEPDVPKSIQSDEQRVQQILKNFLSNAVKFTEKGSITCRIHRPSTSVKFKHSELRAKKSLAFSVIDTGIGIPIDKQHIIFQDFQQANGTVSQKYGGTGLGLTISTKIAELLGGEIQVKSQFKQGSTFTLYLPIQTP